MNTRGRPMRGFFGGLILGILVDLDLAFGGVVKLNSVVLTIVPIAGLVIGLLLGLWAPIGRSGTPSMAAATGTGPVSAPPTVTTVPSSTPAPTSTLPDPVPPATPPAAPAPEPSAPEDTPPI